MKTIALGLMCFCFCAALLISNRASATSASSSSAPPGYPTGADYIVFKNRYGNWSAVVIDCNSFYWNGYTCGANHEYPLVHATADYVYGTIGFPDWPQWSTSYVYINNEWTATSNISNWPDYYRNDFYAQDTIANDIYISTLNLVYHGTYDYHSNYGGLNITKDPTTIYQAVPNYNGFVCPQPAPIYINSIWPNNTTGCFALDWIDNNYYGVLWFTDSATSQSFPLADGAPLHVDWSGQVSVEGANQVYYQWGCDSSYKNCQTSGSYDPAYFNSVFANTGTKEKPVWVLGPGGFQGFHSTRSIVDPNGNLIWQMGSSDDVCSFSWCTFPNFETMGQYIGGEYVFQMDIFKGVPSYLNSKTDGSGSSSYYQCTEYAARYLNSRFGTDYTDSKNINDSNTQGFRGFDFHPNYGGNPPKPTVDKDGKTINLVSVTEPQAGDIAIFTLEGHTAIIKSVIGTTANLIEQNYISNHKYKTNRTISTSAPGLYFYRFTAAVIQGADSPYTSIQNAYDSVSTNGQTVMTKSLVFTESPDFANDISITFLGGYDDDFSSATGWTIVNGQLTISKGSVTLDHMCVK